MKKLKLSRSARKNAVLFLILAAMCVFFYATTAKHSFGSAYNIFSMLRQSVPSLVLACTMCFVIASGSIDLSISGVMAFCAMIFGFLCLWGVNVWLALVLVMVLGGVIGVLNTVIQETLRIPSIMATLATQIIFSGLAFAICRAIPINDPLLKPIVILNKTKIFGSIPVALPIILVVIAIFVFLEKKTVLGKYAIAIGGNPNAVHFSGINVVGYRTIFFVLSGMMAAFAGVWQVARLGCADPHIGTGFDFDVVAACVLGGVNIKGGEGTIAGVVIGTCIIVVLKNGMQLMGIDSFYQNVVTGIVLFVAVLAFSIFDMLSMRKKIIQSQ